MGRFLKVVAVALSLAALPGCDTYPMFNKGAANEQTCTALWGRFADYMAKAKAAEHEYKIYYAQIADMNLHTLLERGCCRFQDTCPYMIQE